MTTRLHELLLSRECGYLSSDEIETWVEGRLALEKRKDWEAHAANCGGCTELLQDLELFQSTLASDLGIASEKQAYDRTEPRVRRALGLDRPERAARHGWGWWTARLIAVAAVFALLLLRPTTEFMFDDVELIALQPPPAVRGSSAELWSEAQRLWDQGDYRAVGRVFEAGLAADPRQADLAFYLGIARLYADDADGAVEALRSADALQAELPSETTRWMLATALDRAGAPEEACSVLVSIMAMHGDRVAAAEKIVAERCL